MIQQFSSIEAKGKILNDKDCCSFPRRKKQLRYEELGLIWGYMIVKGQKNYCTIYFIESRSLGLRH